MADFNWNQFQRVPEESQPQQGQFDWNQYQKGMQTTAAEALGQGALRGATFNLSDRVKALLSSDDYDTALKKVRDYNKTLDAEHPIASTVGKIGGGTASIMLGGELLGGAGAAAEGAEAAAGAGEAAAEAGEALTPAVRGLTAPVESEISGMTQAATSPGTAAEAAKITNPSAFEQLFPRFSKYVPSGVPQTLSTGAALGALSAAGGAEDYTNVGQTAQDIAKGAAEGAVGAGVLGLAGKALGAVGSRIGGLPASQELAQSFKAAAAGKQLSGAEAATRKMLSDNIESQFLGKIGRMQDAVGQAYDNVLDNSKVAIDPTDVSSAANNVIASFKKQFGNAVANQEGTVNSILAPLFEEPITARSLDMASKSLQKYADSIYNPIQKTGDPIGYEMLTNTRQALKDVLTNSLDPASKDMYAFADQQNYLLSQLRAKLGIPKGISSEAGSQKGQEAYNNALEGLTKDFVGAAQGNAESVNNIKDAFGLMKTVEQNVLGKMPADEKGNLASEADDIAAGLLNNAKDYKISELLNKRSMFGDISKGGLSLKALPANFGTVAGQIARTGQDVVQAPIMLARDVSDLVTSRSQVAADVANRLTEAIDPAMQKAGAMLNKVLMEPEINARRAMMFSLSQQPWFRQAVGQAVGLEGPNQGQQR